MTPEQRDEWLEEFQAWRTNPMSEAFFNSLEIQQAGIRSQWTKALWESEADPPMEQLRHLRTQAAVLDDVINRKGTDVLASLYPDLRADAEGRGNQSGDETP
tara:strand:- start:248 stop:553 length:306 start_codon:yes stop_codon:yes gene_type:complete